MNTFFFRSYFFAFVMTVASSAPTKETCQQVGPCTFQTSGGGVVDLGQLTRPVISFGPLLESFKFNPCTPFICKKPDDALLCHHRDLIGDSIVLAKGDKPNCTISRGRINLEYADSGSDRTVQVELKCAQPNDTSLKHDFSIKKNNYIFTLESQYACENQISSTSKGPSQSSTTTPVKTTKTTPKTTPSTAPTSTSTPKQTTKTTGKTTSPQKTTGTTKTTGKTTAKTTPKKTTPKKTTPKQTTPKKTTPKKTTPKPVTTTGHACTVTSLVSFGSLVAIVLMVNRVMKI